MPASGHPPRHTLGMQFSALQSTKPDGNVVTLGCFSEQRRNGISSQGRFERVVLSLGHRMQQTILSYLPRVRVRHV